MNKYYDRFELEKILSNMHSNPKEAILKIVNYQRKYPQDYISYINLSELLLYVGEIDEADKVLEKAKDLRMQEKNTDRIARNSWFHHVYNCVKLRILFRQGNYKKTLDFYESYQDRFNGKYLSYVKLYIEKNLGVSPELREDDSYLFKQIKEYDYDRFLDHVIRHTNEFDGEEEIVFSKFNNDFPLIDVLEEVKKKLSTSPKLFSHYIDDTYIFKYNDCGRVMYKLQDYFKVVCLGNSKNIITMYPCTGCEKLPSVDLNYLKTSPEEPTKVKKLTAIEKFNKRYNIK